MKRFPLRLVVLFLLVVIHPAMAGVTFGPVRGQAGKSIRLVTHSETTGGTIERKVSGKTRKGTISITRDRDIFWTFRAPAEDGSRRGMVRVAKISTVTDVKMGDRPEKTNDESPLTGKMFAMTKDASGDWQFELDGSVPMARMQDEIDELKVYLKRNWYPEHEVELGDSWEFDPAWVKMVMEKDLSKAQTIGTMTLRQIRHTQKGEFAIIDMTIRSSGGDFKSDGSESVASIELSGQVVVNLETMLDETLELKGSVTTATRKADESTTVKLPFQLTVTKSFVREPQSLKP